MGIKMSNCDSSCDIARTVKIEVHALSKDPTSAWKELSKSQYVTNIEMMSPNSEVPQNYARVVCMSDTHSMTSNIKFNIPNGDIFIHAGDFTQIGKSYEVLEFNNWLATLPHKYKIVIAGNHELSFDKQRNSTKTQNLKQCLTNCIYLEDKSIEICGLKIYGTPWQPEFCGWAFNVPRGQECLDKWNKIPSDIDILITHGPPIGHGDLCCTGVRAGCVELLASIQQRIKPKYHVFGHIHEGYGVTSDGNITYINASTCNINYKPTNPPIVFDILVPKGKK